MSRSARPEASGRGLPLVLALGVLIVQVLAALSPELTPLDHEELYNAGHAWLLQLEHIDAVQQLQYRSYCGGCAVNALIGAGIFGILGPSLIAWKLVPILFTVVAAGLGAATLSRHIGPLSATVFAGLFMLPPATWQHLSLVGWGNHMESGCVAVVAASLLTELMVRPTRGRAVALGAVVGLALWIGFSGGFVALAVGSAVISRRLRHLAPLVVLSALPVVGIWWLQTETTGLSIFDPIYVPGERIPRLSRVPTKLWSLLAPRQLVALFGTPDPPWGWALGWAWAAAGAWALVRTGRGSIAGRVAARFILCFVTVYALVRFTVWAPPAPEIAPPGSMRYAAPLYPLLFFAIAAAIGATWREGRRRLALVAAAPLLLAGLLSRSAIITGLSPSAAVGTLGPDLQYFRDQAGYRLSPDVHAACTSAEPGARSVHAYGLGWHRAQAAIDESPGGPLPALVPEGSDPLAFFEAVGAATWTHLDPSDQSTPRLLEDAQRFLQHQRPTDQRAALIEFGRRRGSAWLDTMRSGRPHDHRLLEEINRQSRALPEPAGQALRFSLGRQWAMDLARWPGPQQLTLPRTPVPGPGFLEGLAAGLGERWGPGVTLRQWWPGTSPPSEAIVEAYRLGSERRWLSRGARE